MDDQSHGDLTHRPDLETIEHQPCDLEIDLEEIRAFNIVAHDMVHCVLSGSLTANHDFNRTNLIRCRLTEIRGDGASFHGVDTKDSLIEDSEFCETTFDQALFNVTVFRRVTFTRCRFEWGHINYCEFHDCVFSDCEFTDILVKRCRIEHSEFRNCTFSNKLFESCVLLETILSETDIQIDTISDNYGLKTSNITDSRIRTASTRSKHEWVEPHEIAEHMADSQLAGPGRVRVEYFLHGESHQFLDALDKLLDLPTWLGLYTVPSTFGDLLDCTSQFLYRLYDTNALSIHTVLRLHNVTGQVGEHLLSNMTDQSRSLYQTVMGIHLSNARLVEEFLEVLVGLADLHADGRQELVLLGEGTPTLEFFRSQLESELRQRGATLRSVVPRNSPAELFVTVPSLQVTVLVLALFLATRLKVELQSLLPRAAADATPADQATPVQQALSSSIAHDSSAHDAGTASLARHEITAPRQ